MTAITSAGRAGHAAVDEWRQPIVPKNPRGSTQLGPLGKSQTADSCVTADGRQGDKRGLQGRRALKMGGDLAIDDTAPVGFRGAAAPGGRCARAARSPRSG